MKGLKTVFSSTRVELVQIIFYVRGYKRRDFAASNSAEGKAARHHEKENCDFTGHVLQLSAGMKIICHPDIKVCLRRQLVLVGCRNPHKLL